jgi:hypothetical protein
VKNIYGLNDEGEPQVKDEGSPQLPDRISSFKRAYKVNLILIQSLLIVPIIAVLAAELCLTDSFQRSALLWMSGFTYFICPLPIAIMLLRGLWRMDDIASLINKTKPLTLEATLDLPPAYRRPRNEIDLLIASGLFDSKKLLTAKMDRAELITLSWNDSATMAAELHKIRLWAFRKDDAPQAGSDENLVRSIDSYWDPDGLVALETNTWLAIVPSLFTEVYQTMGNWTS